MSQNQKNVDSLSDPFDRQKRIKYWDQKLIEQQICLCLGIGGLGSLVVINLCRLGVKKIILVDNDIVNIHNLNRQILYSLNSVGKSKIQEAMNNSQFHAIGQTEFIGIQADAVKEWSKIVNAAKNATIVFNMIDVGDFFDIAIQSLCLKLKIPVIMGGTFASTLTVDYFSEYGKPCLYCLTEVKKEHINIIQQLTCDKIMNLDNIDFIIKNQNPIGQSNILLASTCANFMVSMFIHRLFKDESTNQFERYYNYNIYNQNFNRVIFYINTFECIKFKNEPNLNCIYCQTSK